MIVTSDWLSAAFTGIATLAAISAHWRGKRQASQEVIDARIQAVVGVQLVEINAGIRELHLLLPSRDMQIQDTQKITELERRNEKLEKDLDECFTRLRAVEAKCAKCS